MSCKMALSMFALHGVQRVVALQPSATVILQAIGKLDRLVACTKYCVEVCPQAAGRTMVDDSWTAKRDEIVAVHPDLVIAAVPYQEKSVSEILRSGARFLGLVPRTVADIYTDPVSNVYPNRIRNSAVVVRAVGKRADLLDASKLLEEAALDKYVFLRDAYLQRRRSQIYDGRPPREREEDDDEPAPADKRGSVYFPRVPDNYEAVMAALHD